MPLLSAVNGNSVPQDPGFESAMVMGIVLLAILASLTLIIAFFWLNRNRPSRLRQAAETRRARRDGVDPWTEAGRRLDPMDEMDWDEEADD
ncbi:MAG: hypothetical protein MK116_13585 [Phycisphaerales bacterium]|nr:hypothetical protein [Phycisphaerales bacterium]